MLGGCIFTSVFFMERLRQGGPGVGGVQDNRYGGAKVRVKKVVQKNN